jgi:hypothetical protein
MPAGLRSAWGLSPGSTRIALAAPPLVLAVGVFAAAAAAWPLGPSSAGRPRCATSPTVAAAYVIPPAPFKARLVSVSRLRLPPAEPTGRGPAFKRLYRVSFQVIRGNAVLPAGHRYAQFAYVTRKSRAARWCFLKGGSGP